MVVGDSLADQAADFGSGAALYVYFGTHDASAAANADFVLPVTTHAEGEGSFTNHEGRVQRFWPALQPPGMARPAWFVLGALVAAQTKGTAPRSAADAFGAAGSLIGAFSGMSYDDIGSRGAVINEAISLSGD